MRPRRVVRLLRHRTVAFLLAVAVAAAGWELFTALAAPRRLDPALAARLAREPVVSVTVTLGFAPEDFHIRLFQAHGVVRGVRGTTVLLDRVRAEDVRRLARYYWIRRIAAADLVETPAAGARSAAGGAEPAGNDTGGGPTGRTPTPPAPAALPRGTTR
mgnify:CR=1 FL=1